MKLLDNLHWPGAVVSGAIIIAFACVFIFAPHDTVSRLLELLGMLLAGQFLPSPLRSSSKRTPTCGGAAAALALLFVLGSAPVLTGCAPTDVQLHTTIAAALEQAAESSNTIVRQARTSGGYQAALELHDENAGATEDQAWAAAQAAEQQAQPAVEAQRLGAAAAHAYVIGVLDWISGKTDGSDLPQLLRTAINGWQAFTALGASLHIEPIAQLALSDTIMRSVELFLPDLATSPPSPASDGGAR